MYVIIDMIINLKENKQGINFNSTDGFLFYS